ncbi:MAG: AmmeMemoRadiSam system protein B [Candidatus Woesearchaeota archaeon]
MIRQPIVAGQFYDDRKEELLKQIEHCFKHKMGPGSLPKKQREGKVMGVISPHAGYMFSGPCAAHAFKAVAEAEFPDLYICLGPSHVGFHKTCFSMDDWETPLGTAFTDDEFGRILENNAIDINPHPHKEEHSIEVQIPFLQYISGESSKGSKDKQEKLRFVPIMVAEEDWQDAADRIRKAIKEYEKDGRSVCIITSSDFTHYGQNYGFVPFTEDLKENMRNLDKGAIEKIKKLDAEGFMKYCKETGATICGKAPIAAMLSILKGRAESVELLKYYTSGDLLDDYTNAVGYAGISLR